MYAYVKKVKGKSQLINVKKEKEKMLKCVRQSAWVLVIIVLIIELLKGLKIWN